MTYRLSQRSLNNLQGVHPDLVEVVKRAIELTPQDFFCGEGLRSVDRQERLVASGVSQTMNSRHLTGHAVDLHPHPYKGDHDGDGVPNSDDWDAYEPIVATMRAVAKDMGIEITHGWDWGWDAPHHELDWEHYPNG